jgi:hypothetical protein
MRLACDADRRVSIVLADGTSHAFEDATARPYEEAGFNYEGSRAWWSEIGLHRDPDDRLVVRIRTVHQHEGGEEYDEHATAWTSHDLGGSWTRDDAAKPVRDDVPPLSVVSTHPQQRLGPYRWPEPAPPPSPVRVVGGRYRLGQLLAVRGSGDVYEAIDATGDRRVAVKLVTCIEHDPTRRHRLVAAAPGLTSLVHPNVARVLHVHDPVDGAPLVVTDGPLSPAAGRTLENEAGRYARWPITRVRVRALAVSILSALEAAHEVGLFHGALRPENVYVGTSATPDADTQVTVTEIGLATIVDDPARTTTGIDVGQLGCSPLERVQGAAPDALSDVYGAGLCLWEMLARRAPFTTRHVTALMSAIAVEGVPPIRSVVVDVPLALADVVDRATAKDRAARFASARAMREALEAVQLE